MKIAIVSDTHNNWPNFKKAIDWIKKESIIDESCIIESNLEKQLASLNQQNSIKKPWIKPTFTVKI